jgi:hypothetical protein
MKWVVSFTPQLLYLQGKIYQYSMDKRLGGLQSRSFHCGEKSLAPVRNWTLAVQPRLNIRWNLYLSFPDNSFSRIRRSISMVPERILFQLWLPHLLFSRIHCFFFRRPTKTMNRGFTVHDPVFYLISAASKHMFGAKPQLLIFMWFCSKGICMTFLQGNICHHPVGMNAY